MTLAPVRRTILAAVAALVWFAGQATAAEPATTRVETFALANGMQVVVIPDHRVPVVTHMVWYRTGAADDPWGTSGVAHFLEHLMFKSTAKRASGEFSRIITRIGGRDNAFTSHDTTYYFQRVAREHLATVMALEADRMANLRLVEEEVRTERDVVREERRATVEGNPLNMLGEQMLATLYVNHPYGRPVLGWAHEIERLTRADAATFYARYYAPNNAILVIGGDVAAAEVKSLADKTYARVKPNGVQPARHRPMQPEFIAARRVLLEHERAGTPSLLRFYAVPSLVSAEPGVAEALEVLAYIIGGDDTSRLYRSLVARNLAAAAGTNYVSNVRDSGRLAFVLLPVDGVALDRAEAAMDEVLAGVRENGVSEDEIARAKASLGARRIFDADNQMQLARRYGEGLTIGRTLADIQNSDARLDAVTASDVAKAAKMYLDARRSVTGTLTPPTAPAKTAASKP
jgi:zinc protease